MNDSSNIELIVAAERPRLARLCARLSGNWDAAEDLAQETLLRAWRYSDRMPDASQAAPWLCGIARNVCLEWSRRYYRDQKRFVQPASTDSPDCREVSDQLPNTFDLDLGLERDELITLLNQALALLPPETQAVLVQRYIEETSYAEIAARLGVSENVVAVRAYRGKQAFQSVLSHELRAEAVAVGLLKNEGNSWEETRIWCPHCADHRLLGRFQQSGSTGVFELRCPVCNDGGIGTRADLAIPFFAEMLGSAKTYKPAFSRLLTVVGKYCRQALASQTAPCLVCGSETSIWLGTRPDVHSESCDRYETRISCRTCDWGTNYEVDSFALILPEAQQFWRAYPRLRLLPTREIETQNTQAFLTGLRSATNEAGLDILALRDTCEVIGVYEASTHAYTIKPT